MLQFVFGFLLGFVIATVGLERTVEVAAEGITEAQTQIKEVAK